MNPTLEQLAGMAFGLGTMRHGLVQLSVCLGGRVNRHFRFDEP